VRTLGSVRKGCGAFRLERSPSTSRSGSVKLQRMCSTWPPQAMSTRPLPPCSIRRSTSSSTCMFQAKSYSPVWITARAADTASPPPFISTRSKNGQFVS
jgi:hypothetical protein